MKAIYQKPTTDILLVKTQALMGASLGKEGKPNSINLDDATSTDELPVGWTPGSRRGNLWNDEEE